MKEVFMETASPEASMVVALEVFMEEVPEASMVAVVDNCHGIKQI